MDLLTCHKVKEDLFVGAINETYCVLTVIEMTQLDATVSG